MGALLLESIAAAARSAGFTVTLAVGKSHDLLGGGLLAAAADIGLA